MALLFGELPGSMDLHRDEQIAASASADIRQPFAAQSECGSGAGAFRNLHRLAAVQRRHLHLATQHDGREVHRDLAEEVRSIAPEEVVLLNMDNDVEVSRRTAGTASFTFTLQAQLLAARDPSRNLDRNLALFRHPSGAATGVARLREGSTRTAALGTRRCDGEEALLTANLPLTATERADDGRASRRCARTAARFAGFVARNLNRRLGAV